MAEGPTSPPSLESPRGRTDGPFLVGLAIISSLYLLLIVAMLVADVAFIAEGAGQKEKGGKVGPTEWLLNASKPIRDVLQDPQIRYSLKLSLISCSITAILSVWIAVPLGYLMSRYRFRGKLLLDVLLDVPIVLPPLVIGLSLLILFATVPGRLFQRNVLQLTYAVPGVIAAQFAVAAAFAVRTLRVTFDQISPRQEQVALTLGASRSQAFWLVVLPQARRGVITALTLAWARSLGEFGPVLVFAGATRMHTEVLPTSVFLELSIGSIEGAVAVSLLMVAASVLVLVVVRVWGAERLY